MYGMQVYVLFSRLMRNMSQIITKSSGCVMLQHVSILSVTLRGEVDMGQRSLSVDFTIPAP
jgi:hypothetical protein